MEIKNINQSWEYPQGLQCTNKVQFCFWIQNPKWRGCFKFLSSLHVTVPRKRKKGPNQGVHKGLCAKEGYTFPFVCYSFPKTCWNKTFLKSQKWTGNKTDNGDKYPAVKTLTELADKTLCFEKDDKMIHIIKYLERKCESCGVDTLPLLAEETSTEGLVSWSWYNRPLS